MKAGMVITRCRLLTWLLTVAAGCLCAVPSVSAPPTYIASRKLLERATRIASLKDWNHGFGYSRANDRPGNSYYWITDDDLLIFRYQGQRKGQDSWLLSRRRWKTGKETPLPWLSARFNQYTTAHTWSSISPDGKYFLWYGLGFNVATISGSTFLHWDVSGQSATVGADWLGDSRHWVEWITGRDGQVKGMIRHDVEKPAESRQFKLRRVDPLHIQSTSPYSMPIVTWDNHMLVAPSPWPETFQAYVSKIGIGARGRWLKWRVRAPTGWAFAKAPTGSFWETAIPSQGGRQIAWLCRYLGIKKTASKQRFGLYVSDVRGYYMRLVGEIEMDQQDDDSWPYDIRWLPSGRYISFIYGGFLYRVSVK